MEIFKQIKEVIDWVTNSATSLIGIGITFMTLSKLAKTSPKEEKKLELENQAKEIDLMDKLVKQYNECIEASVEANKNYEIIKEEVRALRQKIEEQDIIIAEQAKKIKEQELEISNLICELNNYKLYTDALIKQIKDEKMIPVQMKDLKGIQDCSNKGAIVE